MREEEVAGSVVLGVWEGRVFSIPPSMKLAEPHRVVVMQLKMRRISSDVSLNEAILLCRRHASGQQAVGHRRAPDVSGDLLPHAFCQGQLFSNGFKVPLLSKSTKRFRNCC